MHLDVVGHQRLHLGMHLRRRVGLAAEQRELLASVGDDHDIKPGEALAKPARGIVRDRQGRLQVVGVARDDLEHHPGRRRIAGQQVRDRVARGPRALINQQK